MSLRPLVLIQAFIAFFSLAMSTRSESLALKPFEMNHRATVSSVADVSFLLDAPAGKDGFIRVQDGHLVKPNGERIRFWGVHLTDWSKGSVLLPPKKDTAMWADTLARFGVNMVRLHFIDLNAPRGLVDATRDDSRHFDAEQLDRLDFLVAELKKRGIYVNLNLNVGRSYKAGDGVADHDKIRWAKGLVLFDTRLIELQKEYARQILTHVNPYTKTEYRREPAVAIVEILNENGLYVGFRTTPHYDAILTGRYNAWLAEQLSADDLAKLRVKAGVDEGAPVPRLTRDEVKSAPKERFDLETRFIIDAEDEFFQDMDKYLKETLGVKAPVVGTADHGHSSSAYSLLASISKLDIVDGHVYWQHPGTREPKAPMVNDPLNSTVVQLSRTAFAGKPYTVSETNHPFPNDWAAEGIPILAAYGNFQDWDAIIMYTFEPKRAADWKPYVGDAFDISLDPVRMTQMATGALTFLRGDVRPAVKTLERTYSREQVIASRRLPRTEEPYFTPGFPLSLPLRHGVRIRSFDGPPTENPAVSDADPILADTKELAWHTSGGENGLVTVDTDRTQSLIGFVNARETVLKNLAAEIENDFAAIVLTAMDSEPLSRSSKMLLTAGSRVENTGMVWNETRSRLAEQGGPPTLVEPVSGTITLRALEGATTVTSRALDGRGHPMGDEIAGKKTAAGWTIPIGEPATTWYVITVEHK
jgi:hypothetical protein